MNIKMDVPDELESPERDIIFSNIAPYLTEEDLFPISLTSKKYSKTQLTTNLVWKKRVENYIGEEILMRSDDIPPDWKLTYHLATTLSKVLNYTGNEIDKDVAEIIDEKKIEPRKKI